jgi:hypothetical protein
VGGCEGGCCRGSVGAPGRIAAEVEQDSCSGGHCQCVPSDLAPVAPNPAGSRTKSRGHAGGVVRSFRMGCTYSNSYKLSQLPGSGTIYTLRFCRGCDHVESLYVRLAHEDGRTTRSGRNSATRTVRTPRGAPPIHCPSLMGDSQGTAQHHGADRRRRVDGFLGPRRSSNVWNRVPSTWARGPRPTLEPRLGLVPGNCAPIVGQQLSSSSIRTCCAHVSVNAERFILLLPLRSPSLVS